MQRASSVNGKPGPAGAKNRHGAGLKLLLEQCKGLVLLDNGFPQFAQRIAGAAGRHAVPIEIVVINAAGIAQNF